MSEHDPLLALGGLIDEPVAPRPAFAEALRTQLIAEFATDGRPPGKESSVMNLAAPAVITRLPEREKRTRRQRLMTAFEIAAVAAIMIGVIAALSPGRWDRSDSPTPASNPIQAMAPVGTPSPAASPNAETGLLWRVESPENSKDLFRIAVADGSLYRVVSDAYGSPVVSAIDTSTGNIRWTQVVDSASGGIAADANGVYLTDLFGNETGSVVTLDPETGEQRWSAEAGYAAYAPMLGDGVIYIWNQANELVTVNALSGEIELRHVIGIGRAITTSSKGVRLFQGPSAILDSTIVLGGLDGSVTAIDVSRANGGSVVWSRTHSQQIPLGFGISGDVVVTLLSSSNLDQAASSIEAVDRVSGKSIWRREVGIAGTLLIANDAVVIAHSPVNPETNGVASDFVLSAYDPATGDERWSIPGISPLQISSDGTTIFGRTTDDRFLVAISAADGRVLGSLALDKAFYGPVVADDQAVYGRDWSNATVAYSVNALLNGRQLESATPASVEGQTDNPTTHNLPDGVLWEKPLAVGLYSGSSTVVVDTFVVRAVSTTTFTGLQGINSSTGEQLWQREFAWTGQIISGDGLVYVPGTMGQGISAIDPATGETRWTSVSMVGNSSFPVFKDGVVYVWSTANIVFAVDAKTGASLWQAYMTPDSASSGYVIRSDIGFHTPAVGKSVVVVASAGGRLYAFDRATGDQLWTYDALDDVWAIRYASSDDTLILVMSSASEGGQVPLTIQGIDLATGSVIWQTAGFGNINQIPVITTSPKTGDATVSLIAQEVQSADQAGTPIAIPASNTGIVFTLDVKTGVIVQQSHGTNYTAIASTDDGTGLLLWPLTSRSTNEPLDLGQPIDGIPVKSGETIYVTLNDGTLVAIDRTKFAAG